MSTILIVDDIEQNRYLLRAILAAVSHEVLEAANGAEALGLARRTRPDLIISDILMPQMDGFALCHECKRDEALRDIPFVFYTATYTDPRDEALALQLGAARFIVKPVESEDLIAMVCEVLQAHAAGQLAAPQLLEQETVYYRLYNEALIRKLEDKMLDLESLNRTLAESEERFRRLAENAPDLIYRYEVAPQRGFTYVSPAATTISGYTPDEHYADPDLPFKLVHLDDRSMLEAAMRGKIAPDQPLTLRWTRKDGQIIWVEQRNMPIFDAVGELIAIEGIVRDITEGKRAEQLKRLISHAQKMESVGRLAGGVAHDFNNMLSVILGYTELALTKLEPSSPLCADLKEVLKAAIRSTEITRQLLAFSRKQTITPVVLNLNYTVEGMLKMLRRLIGENIDVVWMPGVGLWPVRMDPGQVDQILVNLCVNAQDAIADAGKVFIATDNVIVNETHCTQHADFVPGAFVLLAVRDDGCGMDQATLNHIFEAFFTTKELGKGTGLGLATVAGIVKQNGGFINVCSEPGKGTAFNIYLPRHESKAEPIEAEDKKKIPLGRGETVLLVEDEVAVLKIVLIFLKDLGYTVLAARTPQEAISLARTHAGQIHLLISDVIMPEMNGRDLVERLHSLCPDLKTLFMSGYTADVISHRGVLDDGESFIQKPFSMNDLAVKVSKVLLERGTANLGPVQ